MAYDSEQEQKFVFEAICGIAAVCDGAQERDFQGFDGADTKWGRGIATVPFEDWTGDDVAEAARLLNKYSRQGSGVLGFDPRDLQIVQDHADDDTYYASREHSRQARRRAAASDIIRERKATLLHGGKVQIGWNKKDPDFGAMLERVRALPNRKFDPATKSWTATLTQELVDLIEEFDLDANFEARVAVVAAAQAQAEKVHLTLENGQVILRTDKSEAFKQITQGRYAGQTTKDAFKLICGFRWDGQVWSLPSGRMNATVLDVADAAGFRVADDVKALVAVVEERQGAADTLQALLSAASRAKDISELPEAFQARVREALGQ